MVRDPVCSSVMEESKAPFTWPYKNKTYFFCCTGCLESFKNDPKKYIGRTWWQRFLNRLADSNAKEFGDKKPTCH